MFEKMFEKAMLLLLALVPTFTLSCDFSQNET